MLNLRQIRSFIAVYEEGSFTRAAARENVTQSGVSQHVAALEHSLGAPLFDRGGGSVVPNHAGRLFYARSIAALRSLDAGVSEVRAARGGLSGQVRAGLMPAFTRAALAPALESFVAEHPQVRVEVIEGYSGALSDMVRAGSIDFALVPAGAALIGLDQSPIARDREMLVTAAGHAATAGVPHMAPVQLAALGPLRVVVPGKANVRRARLDAYFAAQAVAVTDVLEMDSMLGTLELVARSDWVAVLPGIICAGDADGRTRRVHPLTAPDLHSDFVLIEPARGVLSSAARAFVAVLRREITALIG